MLIKWKENLDLLGIEFREDMSIIESLSTASQRLTWQSEGLPSDKLSLENGVIIDRGIRFPLVIDPSGQAIAFLMNHYKEEKIQTTSFLDKAFTKTLAGAVRFGTALLVENVEKIDPILNPILNRELQRTGGRTLVRIGTEEVDYSPKFRIILSTKNPAVQLTPDVCSRVTLVNFTVTADSLESQSLTQIVRSMKPELESQRAALLKLQGEQNVKLRELEEQMLAKISACEGSILDDDAVVDGMEILMKEGASVEEQISQSSQVMEQVHQAVARFEPLAGLCRKIFVLLESLRELSFLYEFPAKTFMGILDFILEKSRVDENVDESSRIANLKSLLFTEVAARIGRGLQIDDKIVFSILLARLSTNDESIGAGEAPASSDEFVKEITRVFGDDFPWQGRSLSDLADVTRSELSSTTPLLLCSAPGHDVSGRVDAMARELKQELASVAMGSAEGYETAESLVSTAAKRGSWVMLKNVHLCVEWLRDVLVKKIQGFGLNTHPEFRLFITSEINPRLPPGLLRVCDTMVAQAPSGIKASLQRFLSSIAKDRFDASPIRNRLYFLLGWVHAVIQERLRFVPDGWTEAYEWTEADANHGLDVMDALAGDAKDPEKLAWDAMRETLRKGVYGGRITEDRDQKVLDALVNSVFCCQAFDVDFLLVPTTGGPTVPEKTSRDDIMSWCQTLPSRTPPTWIGLDNAAEDELEKRLTGSVTEKVVLVQRKCQLETAASA
jgi:dynein heavy chain 1, cytosolic